MVTVENRDPNRVIFADFNPSRVIESLTVPTRVPTLGVRDTLVLTTPPAGMFTPPCCPVAYPVATTSMVNPSSAGISVISYRPMESVLVENMVPTSRTIASFTGWADTVSVTSPATVPTMEDNWTSILLTVPGMISMSSTNLVAYPWTETSTVFPLCREGMPDMRNSPLPSVVVVYDVPMSLTVAPSTVLSLTSSVTRPARLPMDGSMLMSRVVIPPATISTLSDVAVS